ncbi:CusA/CzcA family heavy metal efflux RND transporter [Flavobacterium sp. Fl-318]|uniref:CusA/CzcA family heavy metal efflux RND transporter n=1 Tax=Flavobacterium cupriresistens TaxID=2893885 RepID=A0ABU4RA31_9FLAO|nr:MULTISPECIES: CusA/CzcA family heavy metal efflux RND transporter [unclassified Flavobacterium]MDX6189443.1 CusA/CzcA family heavy metal efflux RND transporter [Flavobacterium sp. Fl-318]UFH41147.1 CusA/CzcA family heavy metal efflux RND transporter [Flavobacterium sp. F-323]
MNKFIKNIIAFSLKNKAFTFFWVGLLAVAGFISFKTMPIDAFPDVTNTQIIIITQWNGKSAEEVERFVTSPIEISMNSVQKKTSVRSITMFGLSVIKIIFDDGVDDTFARFQVNNLLKNVSLPDDVEPDVQPPYGPTGEIFRYIIKSKSRDSRELLTYQNWVIDKQLRSLPGVADLNVFGGQTKTYEVAVDPIKLAKYNITPLQVYNAVNAGNLNVGGDVIEKNGQAFVVRGVGLLKSIPDIENIIVDDAGGNPILVKNLAAVNESSMPRVGQTGIGDNDDAVEGIIVMRKGENPQETLALIKAKIKDLNDNILPKDITLETFYDRDNLMNFTTETVMHNLFEGIILVTCVVFLFMADWRTTFTVSIVIPLSLLFAFLCLKMMGMSANLLSLGAVDFGIIIDGAVVMVEGLFVVLDRRAHQLGMTAFNKIAKGSLIKRTGTEMGKAIFFSKLIIITALLPIFSFQKVEGKMFSPLAYTLGFALMGALIFTLTLVPVLSHILLNKNVKEKHNPFVNFWDRIVGKGFAWTFKHKAKTLIASIVLLATVFFSATFLGTEFLPQLNEGALWVTAELPMSTSLPESVKTAAMIRKDLESFPEVKKVLSQTGRSNDGTDPNGFGFIQLQVDLKPKAEWTRKITMDDLINQMDQKLKVHQGITYNYSQPVIDNVAESVAGFKASNAVKIYGDDLNKLDELANEVLAQIKNIPGIKDAGILRNVGQPEISVILDREKMAAYGVTLSDAQAVLELAFGGKTATEKYEDEKKFDVRVRFSQEYRKDEKDLEEIKVPTISGIKIPLKEISDIKTITGPAFIYRDNTKRFIGVKFSVRDRDLGSTIAEAQQKVDKMKLPQGYTTGWTGEFENQVRASARLAQVVPISLIGIFVLLFILFGNIKDSLLVLANVPFAIIGGIIALHLTRMNFGISAGVGFIALLGICIQNGVILISEFHHNLKAKFSLEESIFMGVKARTRAVVMTALMASIGLMPAAISTGIGSESQKPLAIVIIGGLITATILTLLVFPIIFWVFNRKKHVPIE